MVNLECKEIAYIQQGQGKIVIDDKLVELNEGDVVLIEPNEKFYWEGEVTMIMVCHPSWSTEQHRYV